MPGFGDAFATDTTDGNTPVLSLEDVRAVGLRSGFGVPSLGSSADLTQTASLAIEQSRTNSLPAENRKKPASAKAGKNGKGKKATKSDPKTMAVGYAELRRVCDAILTQVRELKSLVDEKGVLSDGWEGPVIEIKALLMSLRGVKWGNGDSLKRWITTLWFQIANATWDARHVALLLDATQSLRVRYVVDSSTVDECVRFVKKHGLDPFRATATTPEVKTRYKTVPEE